MTHLYLPGGLNSTRPEIKHQIPHWIYFTAGHRVGVKCYWCQVQVEIFSLCPAHTGVNESPGWADCAQSHQDIIVISRVSDLPANPTTYYTPTKWKSNMLKNKSKSNRKKAPGYLFQSCFKGRIWVAE